MGFSFVGALVAVAILLPSVLLAVFPPRDGIRQIEDAGLVFTVLERAGQVGCLVVLAGSASALAIVPITAGFVAMLVCIVVYYGLWLRYLVHGRTVRLLFAPLAFVPIPMAVFPVLAFAFAAWWSHSPWLLLAVIVLAVGHLTNSWHSFVRLRAADARAAEAPAANNTRGDGE